MTLFIPRIFQPPEKGESAAIEMQKKFELLNFKIFKDS